MCKIRSTLDVFTLNILLNNDKHMCNICTLNMNILLDNNNIFDVEHILQIYTLRSTLNIFTLNMLLNNDQHMCNICSAQ